MTQNEPDKCEDSDWPTKHYESSGKGAQEEEDGVNAGVKEKGTLNVLGDEIELQIMANSAAYVKLTKINPILQ